MLEKLTKISMKNLTLGMDNLLLPGDAILLGRFSDIILKPNYKDRFVQSSFLIKCILNLKNKNHFNSMKLNLKTLFRIILILSSSVHSSITLQYF